MPVNQFSHEKDSKAFILRVKVGKEVEFAKYAAITNVFNILPVKIVNQPIVYVAGSVLNDDGPWYFKEVLNGEILEDEYEFGEGFEDEQEIVKDLASKIYIPKA